MTGDTFLSVPSLSLQEDSHRSVFWGFFGGVFFAFCLLSDTHHSAATKNSISLSLQTWMWVIAPMFLYVCERLIRFVRYMQTVRYRRVRSIRRPSLPSGAPRSERNLHPLRLDRDAAVQGAGAAAGEEWFQNGSGPVRLPQLSGHLAAGVASVHHDLGAGGRLFQRPHSLGRRLDRQAH